MCVILVCPANVRPDRATLDACHRANPHGAGVAWREDDEVRWSKGLEPDELEPLIAGLPGEIVIHFRWASVGEVTPKLCHPFPITASATTRLTGHARAVLFHNGTWGEWRETLRRMPRHRGPTACYPTPGSPPRWSISAAWTCSTASPAAGCSSSGTSPNSTATGASGGACG